MQPDNNSPILENAGTNPLIVSTPKEKSNVFTIFVSILLSIVIVVGGFAYTLNRYPDFYSNLGLLSETGKNGTDNSSDNNADVDDTGEVKWVTYENKSVGISFSVPANYIVTFDEVEKSDDNAESWFSIKVGVVTPDSMGNVPAHVLDLVDFTDNLGLLYSYDGVAVDFPASAVRTVNIGGKSYEGEAYSISGEGVIGYNATINSVKFDVDSKLSIHILDQSGKASVECSEIVNNLDGCTKVAYEVKTLPSDYANAKRIVESLKFIK